MSFWTTKTQFYRIANHILVILVAHEVDIIATECDDTISECDAFSRTHQLHKTHYQQSRIATSYTLNPSINCVKTLEGIHCG